MLGNLLRVFYSYFNISAATSSVEINFTTNELEKNTLTSTSMEYLPGNLEAEMSIDGYLEGFSSGLESALNSALDSGDQHVALVIDYATIPSVCYILKNAFNNSLSWTAALEDLMTMNGSVRSGQRPERGFLTIYNNSRTSTGFTTGVQVSSIVNGNSGQAFLFLHDNGGTISSNVTIQVQSSQNNSTWSTIGTFTTNSLKSMVVPVTFSGSYIRANVISMGGASRLDFSLIVVKN